MLVAHKIELRPTKKQAEYLYQACGSRRFAYNQLLAYFKQDGIKWDKKEAQNKIRELRSSFDFLQSFSARVVRNVVDDLDNAYKKFFKKQGGYPKFAKKNINESFAIREKEKIKIKDRKFRFEKLPKGEIKMRNKLRFNGVVKQVTISIQGGRWFASFLIEADFAEKQEPSFEAVGVDLGVKELATLSDGIVFPAHKSYFKRERKLRKLQKKLSRQVRGSENYKKTKAKVSKLHFFVAESRKQAIHELTSYLAKNYKQIAIEDLNVKGMVKNRRLSKSIIDASFGMFKEQMKYKSEMYGSKLYIIDRFYPSSKTCSNCGNVKDDLKLSDRVYKCKECGFILDRDLNASMNIKNVAIDSGDTINDYGEVSLETLRSSNIGDKNKNINSFY
jgi:putative transposase